MDGTVWRTFRLIPAGPAPPWPQSMAFPLVQASSGRSSNRLWLSLRLCSNSKTPLKPASTLTSVTTRPRSSAIMTMIVMPCQ